MVQFSEETKVGGHPNARIHSSWLISSFPVLGARFQGYTYSEPKPSLFKYVQRHRPGDAVNTARLAN
ncbi:TOM complex component Tom7 [Penicillium capsulatum]|nr:TOM complex component Tom7 [Penicillium capsulatum]